MAYMALRDLPLSSQKKKKVLRARESQILDEIIYVPESRCVQLVHPRAFQFPEPVTSLFFLSQFEVGLWRL